MRDWLVNLKDQAIKLGDIAIRSFMIKEEIGAAEMEDSTNSSDEVNAPEADPINRSQVGILFDHFII